ncbi:MAG: c-type cytochrome, partial [Lewinellaceae bacterium]|nr:c-type cytochrome [Lewinellaceae bacterium]
MVKKLMKGIAFLLLGIIIIAILGAATIHFRGIPSYEPVTYDLKVEVTPERVAQGEKLSSMLCRNCHEGDDGKLSGKKLLDIPDAFGTIFSRNITQDPERGIGNWTDGQIYVALRTGLRPDGTFLPMYMPKFTTMAEEDIYSVIAYLRSDLPIVQPSKHVPSLSQPSMLTKALCNFVMKPYPLPKEPIPLPDTTDMIARGQYLANGQIVCFACHSGDLSTINYLEPEKTPGFYAGGAELLNLDKEIILSANLTPDPETGIGKYTEEEFVQAVKYGKKRNGQLTRYPMFPHSALTDAEAKAIFAYLRSLPP